MKVRMSQCIVAVAVLALCVPVFAQGDIASLDDLGIDAKVIVTPAVLQRTQRVDVALSAFRIGGRVQASFDSFMHFQNSRSNANCFTDPVELFPGAQTVKPDVAAPTL